MRKHETQLVLLSWKDPPSIPSERRPPWSGQPAMPTLGDGPTIPSHRHDTVLLTSFQRPNIKRRNFDTDQFSHVEEKSVSIVETHVPSPVVKREFPSPRSPDVVKLSDSECITHTSEPTIGVGWSSWTTPEFVRRVDPVTNMGQDENFRVEVDPVAQRGGAWNFRADMTLLRTGEGLGISGL